MWKGHRSANLMDLQLVKLMVVGYPYLVATEKLKGLQLECRLDYQSVFHLGFRSAYRSYYQLECHLDFRSECRSD
jgi:hypothetical protein